MNISMIRGRRFLGRFLFSSALGVSALPGALQAQEPAATLRPPVSVTSPANVQVIEPRVVASPGNLGTVGHPAPMPCGDPCAPSWCDPIERVPNMFGDFFSTTLRANRTIEQSLQFTGIGAEGGNFATIATPETVNGPGGPYLLTNTIPILNLDFNSGAFTLGENQQLTSLLPAGATFVEGGGAFFDFNDLDFFYNYVLNAGQNIAINLPNPAGGGLVGRNNYFENGTPLPHDRVYFFYNHVRGYQNLNEKLDVNRYVFGVEKTILCGQASVEVRLPFAGTANSDQVSGQGLATDEAQFGNVGVLVKTVVCRTPNFVAVVGLGTSAPTASDSRLLVGGAPVIAIENRTWLLQPLAGVAWAPNECFYAQAGVQFDYDPNGNPVHALNANGGLSKIGVLNDRNYALVNAAAGYWVRQNVALQGELHWTRSFGKEDSVQAANVAIGDFSNIDMLSGTTGVIARLGDSTLLSVGVNFPIGNDRLYDWTATAQLNFQFGGPK